MFQGSTFSILMDVEARTVFRKKDLPFALTVPREVFCIDANPRLHTAGNYESVETRPIKNSDIDNLGHVNNRRYGDFAYDAFDTAEIPLLKQLNRIDYYFISELRKGDRVTTEKAVDSGEIRIRGRSETKQEIAFEVVFSF
jgi:acyl-ACP thioesterase